MRASHGFTFMANYTWSRAIDDGGTFRTGYAIPAAFSGNGKPEGGCHRAHCLHQQPAAARRHHRRLGSAHRQNLPRRQLPGSGRSSEATSSLRYSRPTLARLCPSPVQLRNQSRTGHLHAHLSTQPLPARRASTANGVKGSRARQPSTPANTLRRPRLQRSQCIPDHSKPIPSATPPVPLLMTSTVRATTVWISLSAQLRPAPRRIRQAQPACRDVQRDQPHPLQPLPARGR